MFSYVYLDCALHDKNLLLRFDRDANVAIMSFEGQHDEICDGVIRVFEALDLELKRPDIHNAKFHLIGDQEKMQVPNQSFFLTQKKERFYTWLYWDRFR